MTAFTFTTQAQVRAAFWQGSPTAMRKRGRDGDYLTDTRCEFVDFIDMLARDGHISSDLAQRVTL